MNKLSERVFKNLYTTIGGMVVGAATGVWMSAQSGQVTKEALITAAAIGAVGALAKNPKWIKR